MILRTDTISHYERPTEKNVGERFHILKKMQGKTISLSLGGIGDVPRIYGLSMGIHLIPAKHGIKKPYPFGGGYCALLGKTEHGIQNIDYELNFFGGRIP